jgi:hypothetical protein
MRPGSLASPRFSCRKRVPYGTEIGGLLGQRLPPQPTAGAVAVHSFSKISPATIEILICPGFST